jgi:predicted TIM-barrel fold metal-dependent hydrolase
MEEGGVGWSEGVRDELQRGKRNTLYFKRMILDLAKFFGVDADVEAVMTARNAAVSDGYTEYVSRLYGDARLDTVVFDFGIPLPILDIAEVRSELPVEVIPVFRIEPLIADLLKTDIGWAEFQRRYEDTISDALTTQGFKGVKSIIAYRTGLDVSPLSRAPDQGYKALDAIRRGLGGGSMKQLRDHLLCRALDLCMEHDVPMQIHTGMGDFEVNLVLCRPAYLMDLLRFPAYRGCRVLLVHSGYPYHREAAYMANVLPRVWCDLSEGIPFAGNAAWDILRGVLAMAPLTKICYGSDGYKVPEILYSSAKLGKQAVASVLDELVADGMLTQGDAQAAAGLILSGNARELYRV